jgi:hypothetical protein
MGQREAYQHQKLRGDWPVDMRKVVPRDIPWQEVCVLMFLEGELNTTQTPLDTLLDSETLNAPAEPEKLSIPTVGTMPPPSASEPHSDTTADEDEVYPDDSISQQFVSTFSCFKAWRNTGLISLGTANVYATTSSELAPLGPGVSSARYASPDIHIYDRTVPSPAGSDSPVELPFLSFLAPDEDYYPLSVCAQECRESFSTLRASRELTEAELKQYASKVREAQLAELLQWVDTSSCHPEETTDFMKRSGGGRSRFHTGG